MARSQRPGEPSRFEQWLINQRIETAEDGSGRRFAHRADEILVVVGGPDGADKAGFDAPDDLTRVDGLTVNDVEIVRRYRFSGSREQFHERVAKLRAAGHRVSLNTIVTGMPATATVQTAVAYTGSPGYSGSPLVEGNPGYSGSGTHVHSRTGDQPDDPWDQNGAIPVAGPIPAQARGPLATREPPTVIVLDTGLATVLSAGHRIPENPALSRAVKPRAPGSWTTPEHHPPVPPPGVIGVYDEDVDDDRLLAGTYVPAAATNGTDPRDEPRWLDTQAGHGTFVTGLIDRVAPGVRIEVEGVLSSWGIGDTFSVLTGLNTAWHRSVADGRIPAVINMSFSGYTEGDEPDLVFQAAIDALTAPLDPDQVPVFVAAAGNGASSRPTFPAADPRVVAVGALDEDRRASFSNFGGWVDACAPGVRTRSVFLGPDGREDLENLITGHAEWSGTSFAAPKVAGAIVAVMVRDGVGPREAKRRLLDLPGLFRVPDLGIVVNIA